MNRYLICRLLLSVALMGAPTAMIGQANPGSPNQQQDPIHSEPDSTSVPAQSGQEMQDKIFLRKALQGGTAEVQLGKLAVEKASTDSVKSFAQKMVNDHTEMNNAIASLAESKGAIVSTKLTEVGQTEYDKLGKLSGEAFDKEYVSCMVKYHHADLREFRTEAANTNDAELKTALDKAAQIVREHMLLADKLAHEMGIPPPGRGGKSANPTTN